MKFTDAQFEAPILADEDELVADILEHLREYQPYVIEAYPPGYLIGIIRDSISIARSFGVTDVIGIRTFTDLRWSMAAGWFHEPTLRSVMLDPALTSTQKFDRLIEEDMEDAWVAAEENFDRPEDWRAHLWAADAS